MTHYVRYGLQVKRQSNNPTIKMTTRRPDKPAHVEGHRTAVPTSWRCGTTTVSIVSRLRVGQSRVWIPVVARDFSLFPNVQAGQPTAYWQSAMVLSWGLRKWGMMLTTHIHLAQGLRSSGSLATTPPICLQGVDRDNPTRNSDKEVKEYQR